MKRILATFAVLFVLSAVGISFASAQRLTVSSSVPHANSQCGTGITCPPSPTPATGSGGTSPHAHSGDEDGDGIPDGIDQCPNDGGPSSNQGCPAGAILAVQPTLSVLPLLPNNGVCLMATRTNEPVNMHIYPSRSAPTWELPALDPAKFYRVAFKIITSNGSIWYRQDYTPEAYETLGYPAGYALSTVVRLNQDCGNLDVQHWPSLVADMPLLAMPQNLHVTLKPSSVPGLATETARGDCSSSFGIDLADDSGLRTTLNFAFGDGSVQPNPVEGCIQLDADGNGFGILPPDANTEPFSLHWQIGFLADNPTQLALIAQLLPSNVPGDSSDSDKAGVSLIWGLPPDPCKPGDQTCANPGGTRTFTIDWSQASAAHSEMSLSWDGVPPDPCKPGDSSCAANSGKQGVLFGLLPAVQGSFDVQPTAYFFPNGFDPTIGGFTQIENQLNGSNPGDQYGFTLIEKTPQTPQVTLNFTPPAAQ